MNKIIKSIKRIRKFQKDINYWFKFDYLTFNYWLDDNNSLIQHDRNYLRKLKLEKILEFFKII